MQREVQSKFNTETRREGQRGGFAARPWAGKGPSLPSAAGARARPVLPGALTTPPTPQTNQLQADCGSNVKGKTKF